eukprot:GHVU01004304.1.p1 GENE.GHVU01004304.1~~GHVU01004304.1.p1  ORF type:complete len:167 (+),score=16.37 GHVU01004304.1:1842-2342(+)
MDGAAAEGCVPELKGIATGPAANTFAAVGHLLLHQHHHHYRRRLLLWSSVSIPSPPSIIRRRGVAVANGDPKQPESAQSKRSGNFDRLPLLPVPLTGRSGKSSCLSRCTKLFLICTLADFEMSTPTCSLKLTLWKRSSRAAPSRRCRYVRAREGREKREGREWVNE